MLYNINDTHCCYMANIVAFAAAFVVAASVFYILVKAIKH